MATIINCGGGGTVNNCPFPVGFGGFFQTDPNTIYAGTKWEQKKDVFILASGDIYGAGSTGGEAQHKLTVEEMPEHRHKANEWLLAVNKGGNPKQVNVGASSVSYSETSLVPITYSDEGTEGYPSSEAGGGKAHNNMPPYFSMPFWIRTA